MIICVISVRMSHTGNSSIHVDKVTATAKPHAVVPRGCTRVSDCTMWQMLGMIYHVTHSLLPLMPGRKASTGHPSLARSLCLPAFVVRKPYYHQNSSLNKTKVMEWSPCSFLFPRHEEVCVRLTHPASSSVRPLHVMSNECSCPSSYPFLVVLSAFAAVECLPSSRTCHDS
jgi:hypothetical protein